MASWTKLLCALAFMLAPMRGLAADRARVAVVPLEHHGPVTEGVRHSLSEQLGRGLAATNLEVITPDELKPASCVDSRCWRMIAGKLGCRFVAGGSVHADEDRTYAIELWLADGYSGEVVARVRQQCEICGLKAVAERMELAASALGAKARVTAKAPARLVVKTSPPGASIEVDGDPVGSSPQELELPEGEHRIAVQADGHLGASRKVHLVAGVEERLQIKLIPVGHRGRSWREVAGWVVLGAAIVSLAAATTLFAVNGRQVGCDGETEIKGGQCPELLDTRAGAWTTAALGLGAGVLGVYLLLQPPARRSDTALLPTSGGIQLGGRF